MPDFFKWEYKFSFEKGTLVNETVFFPCLEDVLFCRVLIVFQFCQPAPKN